MTPPKGWGLPYDGESYILSWLAHLARRLGILLRAARKGLSGGEYQLVVQKTRTSVTDSKEWEKVVHETAEKVLDLGRRMRPGTEDAVIEYAVESVDRAMRRAVRLALSQESLGRTKRTARA